MRARSSPGGRISTRAAASSMARGRPSSRRQISATAPAFFGDSAKSGLPAAARWTNNAIDAHCISVAGEKAAATPGSGRGGTGELLLAVDVEHQPAGHEHLEGGAGVQQLLDDGGGLGHLLEVVHHEERRAAPAKVLRDGFHQRRDRRFRERRATGATAECDKARVRNRCEVDERHAVEVVDDLFRHLDRQPCLSGAARPRQRHQPDLGVEQHLLDAGELGGAADERRVLGRQVVIATLPCSGDSWRQRIVPLQQGRRPASSARLRPPRLRGARPPASRHPGDHLLEPRGHVRDPTHRARARRSR